MVGVCVQPRNRKKIQAWLEVGPNDLKHWMLCKFVSFNPSNLLGYMVFLPYFSPPLGFLHPNIGMQCPNCAAEPIIGTLGPCQCLWISSLLNLPEGSSVGTPPPFGPFGSLPNLGVEVESPCHVAQFCQTSWFLKPHQMVHDGTISK